MCIRDSYSAYDYISIIIGWDFEDHLGSYEEYEQIVKAKIDAVKQKAAEYGKKCMILLASDYPQQFVLGEMSRGLELDEIRAKTYRIAFEEIMRNAEYIDVVFPHPIWGGTTVKCCRRSLEGAQEHQMWHLFSYQGSKVEELIKEFYTGQP